MAFFEREINFNSLRKTLENSNLPSVERMAAAYKLERLGEFFVPTIERIKEIQSFLQANDIVAEFLEEEQHYFLDIRGRFGVSEWDIAGSPIRNKVGACFLVSFNKFQHMNRFEVRYGRYTSYLQIKRGKLKKLIFIAIWLLK